MLRYAVGVAHTEPELYNYIQPILWDNKIHGTIHIYQVEGRSYVAYVTLSYEYLQASIDYGLALHSDDVWLVKVNTDTGGWCYAEVCLDSTLPMVPAPIAGAWGYCSMELLAA